MAELSGYNREHIAHKAENIYYLALNKDVCQCLICVWMLNVQLLVCHSVPLRWRITIFSLSFWSSSPCFVYLQHHVDPWMFYIGQWCQSLFWGLLCGNCGCWDHAWACFAIFLLGCLFQKISLYFLIIKPVLVIFITGVISQFVANLFILLTCLLLKRSSEFY